MSYKQNLKRYLLVPLAYIATGIILLLLLVTLSVSLGYWWALLIVSALMIISTAIFTRKTTKKEAAEKFGHRMTVFLICVWGISGVAIFGAWLIGSNDSSKTEKSTELKCDEGSYAYRLTQDLMKTYLKSPSTAKFSRFPTYSKGNIVDWGSSCRYAIRSYVDSQNSFGAMLRTEYGAHLDIGRDGTVSILRLEINSEEIFNKLSTD